MNDTAHQFTSDMQEEAQNNPGGWVYKIDWPYPPDAFVPPEAVVGAFKVNDMGEITDHFESNPKYRPVKTASRAPREYMTRILAPHLVSQWMVEIDPEFDDFFPNVPIEGQIGRWYVDETGNYTGQFRSNPEYSGSIET